MPITGGIPIIGFISPTDEGDRYPVTLPKYGLGGLRSVGNQTELYSIPSERREVGMIAFVEEENTYWHLVDGTENENWRIINLYGETGNQGFQGFQGEIGPTGPEGVLGSQGYQGLRGIPGEDGDLGPQGRQGRVGSIGLQGPAGENGSDGDGAPAEFFLQGYDFERDPSPTGPTTSPVNPDYASEGDLWLNHGIVPNVIYEYTIYFDDSITSNDNPDGTTFEYWSTYYDTSVDEGETAQDSGNFSIAGTLYYGTSTQTLYIGINEDGGLSANYEKYVPISQFIPPDIVSLNFYGTNYPLKGISKLGIFGDLGSQSIGIQITGTGTTAEVKFSSPASSKYFYGPSSPDETTTPVNFGDRWLNTTDEFEYAWYPKIPTQNYLNYVYTDGTTSNGYWTNETYSGIETKLDPNYGKDLSAAATASGLGFTTANNTYSGLTTSYVNTYYPDAVSGDYFMAGFDSSFGGLGGSTVTFKVLLQKQQDNTWKEFTTEDTGYVNQIYRSTNDDKYYYGYGTVDVGEDLDRINWYDISSLDLYLNNKNVSVLVEGTPYLIQQSKYLDFIESSYNPIQDGVPSFDGEWIVFAGGGGAGSRYFYGPTAPTAGDGATQGSKWFNTNLGLEFTYIAENDSSQWIIVNAVGIDGKDGITGPTGPPVQFTFGQTFPSEEESRLGDYFLGASGSGIYEGGLFIFARLDEDPSVTGTWWEISGVKGDDGDDGATGVQGFQGFQGFQGHSVPGSTGATGVQGFQGSKGSGKYFYGPTAPESTDDGLTLGSKWFNTEIGAEFTYIIEEDSTTQWVMVNVFSATGPQGPLGGGTGNQGFQGNIGITGTQGFQGFQGFMGITGVQGFQGFQGLMGITGVQGFQGFQGPKGSGKYYYGPTAPDPTDDGLTLGSKWFNTTVGAEFTYIVEGDSTTQWVMVNVFSATGPQGPLGGGTGNQGFQGFQGNIGISGEGYTSAEIRDNYLYVTKVFSDGTTSEVNLGYIGPTGSGFVFDADITAAFGPNKTFGKYEDGDLIPALGKTAVQVIKEALFDVLNPTVSLTSPTTIQFNQTSISNVLNYSYTINTLGAGIALGTIEWKRANESTYTFLTNATNSSGSYTHNTTNTQFNTNAFNYRYTVTDTAGGSASAILTINVQAYAAPSVSITQTGVSVTSPETNTKREKGNVATNISATITKNSAFVPIIDWKFEYSQNGGSWVSTGFTGSAPGSSPFSTGTTTHSPNNTINNVRYRVVVTDSYTPTNSNPATQINFANLIFYGATSSYPSNGNDIRTMSARKFIDDGISSFTLNTGTADNVFVASIPDPYQIIKVIDEATNAEITDEYIFNTNITTVNDFAGNSVNHNVYIMNPAIAYSDGNHPHKITRST